MQQGVDTGQTGAEGVRAIYDGPLGDRLIAAAIGILDPNGDASPKAIKKLIVEGIEVGGQRRQVSREHAALSPMYLGVKAVVAKSFSRIHHANLVNMGILPLVFGDAASFEEIGRALAGEGGRAVVIT